MRKLIIALIVIFAGTLSVPFAALSQAPDLVLDGSGTVYLIENSARRGFPSLPVFQSHGYQLTQIRKAGAADLALAVGENLTYASGALVVDSTGTVYLIENNTKRGFTSAAAFLSRGYSFGQVLKDAGNILNSITAGAVISADTAVPPSASGGGGPPSPLPASGLSVKITSPNGGETLVLGSKAFIKWQQSPEINSVTISYRECEACAATAIASGLAVSGDESQTYTWTLPTTLALGANYKIEITGYRVGDGQTTDTSDGGFSVISATDAKLTAELADDSPVNPNYVSGAKGVSVAKIKLAAAGNDAYVTSLTLAADGPSSMSLFSKVYFYDGTRLLGSTTMLGASAISTLIIPNSSSKVITVLADVIPGVSGTARLGLEVAGQTILGHQTRAVSTGSFTITADGSNPGARTVTAGGRGIPAAVFRLLAADEDVSLSSFALKIEAANPAGILKTSLWNGETLLGSTSNTSAVINFTSPLRLVKNAPVVLTARLDLDEIGSGAANINDTAAVSHDSDNYRLTVGTGLTSGLPVYSSYHFASGYKITLTNAGIILLGDVNMDSLVTADDADAIMAFTRGERILPAQALDNADVSGDKAVNSADADLIKRYARLEIGVFPRVAGAITPPDSSPDSPAASNPGNQPPSVPTVNGFQEFVYPDGVQKIWGFSFDPDTDPVSYEIWWGDGEKFFSGPRPHGHAFFAEHSWKSRGQYQIVVKAGDGKGAFGARSFYIWVR